MFLLHFWAVKVACEEMNKRFKPIRDENPTANWSHMIDKAFEKNVDLAATYMYKASDLKEYDIWGASCCKLEVDILIGIILVKRVDILEDVSESISPGVDVGQKMLLSLVDGRFSTQS